MGHKDKSRNIETVFIAKGIGIILVVFGHYIPADSPEYWKILNSLVYKFHMPLFFFLSGYLFVKINMNNYFLHVKKKAGRLLLPFMSIALLFLIFKYLFNLYPNIKATTNPITSNNFVQLFICPGKSYVPLLWFIYTLMMIFVIYPPLDYLLKNKMLLIFLSSILLLLPLPHACCLSDISKNLPYFALGNLLRQHIDLDNTIHKLKLFSVIILSGMLFLIGYFFILPKIFKDMIYMVSFTELILGIAGIAACISLSMLIHQCGNSVLSTCLMAVGFFSMSIYLLHTIFAGGVKVFFYTKRPYSLDLFEVKAVIAICSGVVAPLLLEKYFLRENFFTRKYILGLTN